MTAWDKFCEAMNRTHDSWVQNPKITARDGRVVKIEWNGFTFVDDKNEREGR